MINADQWEQPDEGVSEYGQKRLPKLNELAREGAAHRNLPTLSELGERARARSATPEGQTAALLLAGRCRGVHLDDRGYLRMALDDVEE